MFAHILKTSEGAINAWKVRGRGDHAKSPSTGHIEGFPEGVDMSSPGLSQVRAALERGEVTMRVKGSKEHYDSTTYDVEVLPKGIPAHWEQSKRGGQYFDPEHYKHNEFGRVSPLVERDGPAPVPFQREEGTIFRGMSYEEYEHSLRTGEIASLGDYNLGEDQKGLTYFSRDPGQASFYAAGFAPWQYKPTINKPAVMVQVRDPGNEKKVAGTGEDEVGIPTKIKTSEIVKVYFGKVIAVDAGSQDIIVEKDWKTKALKAKAASSSGYAASVDWSEKDPVKKSEDDCLDLSTIFKTSEGAKKAWATRGAKTQDTPSPALPSVSEGLSPEEAKMRQLADGLHKMPESQRDNLVPHEYGWSAYVLYEAETLMPKKEGTLKSITENNSFALWQDSDGLANINGKPHLATRQDDPDDADDGKDLKVWAFHDPSKHLDQGFTTAWNDKAEAVAEYKAHLASQAKKTEGGFMGFMQVIKGFMGVKKAASTKVAPLYVSRALLNAEELIKWAKEQGFATVLDPEELHVTIAYSKRPIKWDAVKSSSATVRSAPKSRLERKVETLGDEGAVVLKFVSYELQDRWGEFIVAGASWSHVKYTPHVTLTYEAKGLDLSKVKPYQGPLFFGPEIFEQLDEDYGETVKAR